MATCVPRFDAKFAAPVAAPAFPAAALDLREDVLAIDFSNSLRSGTLALRAALDAVRAGSARKALVVAADCRVPPPDSEFEPLFGDGAAALLIGDQDVVAELQGACNLTSEFIDMWRLPEDGLLRTWEDRFIYDKGYSDHLKKAVQALLKNQKIDRKTLAKAAFYAPDGRRHAAMIRILGLEPAQVQAPLFDKVGNTGTALALMNFVGALEEAKAGDRILLANYGDGADAYIFQATEALSKIKPGRRGIKRHLTSKLMLDNYGKYVKFKSLMQFQPTVEFRWRSSLNVTWRDRNQIYRFHGYRCKSCGKLQYPWQKLCMYCQAHGNFEEVRLRDKKGKLVTFSMDERAPVFDPPSVLAAVNLDGDCRIFTMITDRDTKSMKVGMPVEMTFRRLFTSEGIHNYFWKCKPARE